MRLEIRHAVSQHSVCNGVRLVEGITGKGFQQCEHFFRLFLGDAFLGCTFDEFIALCGEQRLVLFAHRRTEDVRLTECEVCHVARNLHHLLLIHTDTVGILKCVLQQRMLVSHWFPSVLPVDELLHHAAFKRTGAVKCRNRRELLKRIGFELRDDAIHTGRSLQLEDAGDEPLAQQRVGLRVIKRNFF